MRSGTERGDSSTARSRLLRIPALTLAAFILTALTAPSAQAAFGFKTLSLSFTEEDSTPATQAGSHPYAWTTSLALNTTGSGSEELPDGALKDFRIQLPTGLVGTPGLLPHCSHAEFLTQTCPAASEVGGIGLSTSAETAGLEFPLYNLEPLPGNAAELAFLAQRVPVIVVLQIATTPPYNLIAQITNASQAAAFFGSTVTIKGVGGEAPFLTLPRSCAPAAATFEADPWAAPGTWVSAVAPEPLHPTGCGALGFAPTLTATPTTNAARAPSGLDLSLDLRNEGLTSPTGTASADLAAATLTLPPGMTINPAIAAGLGACGPAQLAAETPTSAPGEGCPESAKIGTVEATTPLLEEPVSGTIFLASSDQSTTPEAGAENPFDSRFALYLVLRNARRGILIKQPMRIESDPRSGRLTATIPGIPQLPFSSFDLHLRGGPRGPLTTPGCGSHAIVYELTPSSGAPPSVGTTTFATDRDCAAPAFNPTLTAGTISNAAGSSSPFVLYLESAAGEPNPAALSLTLPPGLSAALGAVPACPEPLIETATCPPDSRLGSARIALGPGAEPLWIPEPGHAPSAVYLAGPYQGAPDSLLISIPAQAGPFDLGPVLLRAPLRIDPITAQASLTITDLPQIIAGVPLPYRAIRLLLDRPGFIRNPTSCEPTQISATATAADGSSAAIASRFQAADCAALSFKPALAVRFSNPARNAHPRITVELDPRAGDANLAAASFAMPAGELLDLRRVRALCARELPPEQCPPASRLGWAVLASPLLRAPLEGPIYLRRPGGARLPDIVAEVRGEGLRFVLHGLTAAPRGRLRVRLAALPDIALSEVRFSFAGGRHGIFANSTSLCRSTPPAQAALAAHNGRHRRFGVVPRLTRACRPF